MNGHRPAAGAKLSRPRFGYRPGYEGDEIGLGVAVDGRHPRSARRFALSEGSIPPPRGDATGGAGRGQARRGGVLAEAGQAHRSEAAPRSPRTARAEAPHHDIVASRDEPQKKHDVDAGATPPPNTKDSDINRLIQNSQPFAEDGGKDRPEEGRAEGVAGGTETDPNKVRAGDMYAAKLGQFLHDRWQYPSVISQGEANHLCVTFQINLTRFMTVWHLRNDACEKERE